MNDSKILECDVTETLLSAVDKDADVLQLRILFEKVSDNDGEPDMLLFYKKNSNINEKDIFTLNIQ